MVLTWWFNNNITANGQFYWYYDNTFYKILYFNNTVNIICYNNCISIYRLNRAVL